MLKSENRMYNWLFKNMSDLCVSKIFYRHAVWNTGKWRHSTLDFTIFLVWSNMDHICMSQMDGWGIFGGRQDTVVLGTMEKGESA